LEGQVLAATGGDRCVRRWAVDTGKSLHHLQGHTDRVLSVSFSPDGSRLASACGTSSRGSNKGGEVEVWEVATGQGLMSLPPGTEGVLVVWSGPGGKRLAGATLRPAGRQRAAASGKWDKNEPGEVRIFQLPGLMSQTPAATALPLAKLDLLWADLASPDAGRAYRAVWALSGFPKQTLPFLYDR